MIYCFFGNDKSEFASFANQELRTYSLLESSTTIIRLKRNLRIRINYLDLSQRNQIPKSRKLNLLLHRVKNPSDRQNLSLVRREDSSVLVLVVLVPPRCGREEEGAGLAVVAEAGTVVGVREAFVTALRVMEHTNEAPRARDGRKACRLLRV